MATTRLQFGKGGEMKGRNGYTALRQAEVWEWSPDAEGTPRFRVDFDAGSFAWAGSIVLTKSDFIRLAEAMLEHAGDRRLALVREVGALVRDGECLEHGGFCEDENDECRVFDLTNDDAVDTLHLLISKARALPGKEEDNDDTGS